MLLGEGICEWAGNARPALEHCEIALIFVIVTGGGGRGGGSVMTLSCDGSSALPG